jgi:hypothetical protein
MTRKPTALLLCCTAVFFVLSPEFAASDGGGHGRPMTPYRNLDDGNAEIKLERIECEMRRSNVTRAVQNFDVDWPASFYGGVENAGMAFVDTARAQDQKDDKYAVRVFHYLEGNDSNGKTVRIEFNRMKSFEVVAIEDKTVRVRLNVFPTTDANAVAKNNLSYAALSQQTSDVVLTISTKNAEGEDLAVVALDGRFGERCGDNAGRNAETETVKPIAAQMQAVPVHAPREYKEAHVAKLMSFNKLTRARYELAFMNDDIWWAVPSVTADSSYPYRVRTKK